MSGSAILSFYVHTARREHYMAVVADTVNEHDHVFADAQVVTWSDLDRLAQEYGVPGDRIFIDEDAREVLDAA